MKDVNTVLSNYRNFLKLGWDPVVKVLDDQEHVADWMQANWEIIVESVVCLAPDDFLEVYGDGADCNNSSSRVWRPDAIPTQRICAKNINNSLDKLSGERLVATGLDEYILDQFVSWDGDQYDVDLPFDNALLCFEDQNFIISCCELEFELRPIN